jgi:hypothetical protein
VVTAKNQSSGLSGDDIEAAKARLAGIGDLGVSPATLYRYIPAAGTANSPSAAEFSGTKPTASVFTAAR